MKTPFTESVKGVTSKAKNVITLTYSTVKLNVTAMSVSPPASSRPVFGFVGS